VTLADCPVASRESERVLEYPVVRARLNRRPELGQGLHHLAIGQFYAQASLQVVRKSLIVDSAHVVYLGKMVGQPQLFCQMRHLGRDAPNHQAVYRFGRRNRVLRVQAVGPASFG
jgi:hypothetical protein